MKWKETASMQATLSEKSDFFPLNSGSSYNLTFTPGGTYKDLTSRSSYGF